MRFINNNWNGGWWSPIQGGDWNVRYRYEVNYLGNWPTIITEFLDGWEWKVSTYENLWTIHSEEFDASAGSFNVSTSHTISSSIQNLYFKNNLDDELYFPVWQHYGSNSATQRVYEDTEVVQLQTKDLLWDPVDLAWAQLADPWSSSTYQSTFHIMEEAPKWILLEGWQWTEENWKAHWRHKFTESMTPWEITIEYKRPIEIKAWDDFYFKVTNIHNWEITQVATWVEAPWFPWIRSLRKKFTDKPIALKEDNWLMENLLAQENNWDSIHSPNTNELIIWTDWEYIEWL